jgi:hypothetical protein
MKIARSAFNLYFLLGCLGLALSGCETTQSGSPGQRKRGKEATTLRLHLEVSPDGSDKNGPVPIYRAAPEKVNVHREPFLDEGEILEAAVVPTVGGWAITLKLTPHGTLVLDTVTSSSKGNRIAVFSMFGQARWLAAPRIVQRVSDGVFTFTPDASGEETERIVRGLNNVARVLHKKRIL